MRNFIRVGALVVAGMAVVPLLYGDWGIALAVVGLSVGALLLLRLDHRSETRGVISH